jgi:ABC-type lipoprotein release transport system permease subunit
MKEEEMPLDPLSPLTFYRRNKRRGLSILMAVSLMVFGIHTVVSLLSTFDDTDYANFQFLSKFSFISPKVGFSISPVIVSKIRSHTSVEELIKIYGILINMDLIVGRTSFNLLGVTETDMQRIIDLCDVRLKEGRLLKARTNEFVLSEEIANARGLKIGDKIGSPVNEMDWMPTEFVLVGILEGDIRLGFVSYEFIRNHELYRPRKVGFIIIPKEGRKEEMDSFLENSIASKRVSVKTHNLLIKELKRMMQNLYLIVGFLDFIITTVISISIGLLNYIYFSQRLEEFGILHALGYSKWALIRRAIMETVTLVIIAWVIGILLSLGISLWAREKIYEPRGIVLNLANPAPLFFTIPVPLAVILFGTSTVAWTLSKLDPVSIIERR